MAAKPDGNRLLNRQWIHPSVGDCVPAPAIHDQRPGERLAQDSHLLFDAPATRVKILVQGDLLYLVPSESHAQPHPPAADGVERGSLPGHQRGLALQQNDDAGGETDL